MKPTDQGAFFALAMPDCGPLQGSADSLTATPSKPAPLCEPASKLTLSDISPISETGLPPHRSHDPSKNLKRTDPFQFGSRYLEETDDVFEFNAWDHVTPDAEYLSHSEAQYEKQRSSPVSDFDRRRFNDDPEKWWNLFYKQKKATFFKNRKWLKQEFPVLADVTARGVGKKVVLEVGAGAGNTAFPLVDGNENDELKVYAYDFSKKAVEVMKEDERCDDVRMTAERWDVATEENSGLPPGLEKGSVDVVVMIFIFSALSPKQWRQAVTNIFKVLKPGGDVLFRDYGKGDLAQVRFKAGRWMGENFYVRGDGTRVYFFEKEELERIWTGGPLEEGEADRKENDSQAERMNGTAEIERLGNAGFEIIDLGVDRRLIVNRQRRIKMYRCWIQGRFKKPG